jgi:hypothetical protein
MPTTQFYNELKRLWRSAMCCDTAWEWAVVLYFLDGAIAALPQDHPDLPDVKTIHAVALERHTWVSF